MDGEKIRVVIVDDEPLALRGLKLRLAEFPEIEIVAEATNGREAVRLVKQLAPDVVFLDIQMPGLDGFGVVRALIGAPAPLFIFVTAYDKYAIDAFEANALDYLVKPVEDERLKDAIHRAREALKTRAAASRESRLVELLASLSSDERDRIKELINDPTWTAKERYPERLSFKDGSKVVVLNADEVEWIDAAGDYMCIHAGGKTHIIRETMKTLEARLDPARFQRIHRSAIVNVNKVKELHPHSNGEYFLILENGVELKLSRSYKDVVARFL
ncbi:LytR/AlgR family response regulator transcription factor [Amphiplicatus metriothermophilus]|uniref:Two component transcriptional regulator, LytTR family n=1 Tax=Amphiplicatus metriothermophilus TaxID=1519374 RepID=A0A239PXX4_9PROT|nr:LytTR family DNA-binding domain-containing protein [Amphiplicatus metriothermophilus]MBB5519974.1 two-component system LytT family response regulator [Amphiplicatus metriothermophilus]SNT74873.1 two component transcriptional regulator, LytTR family [Amphiplicatus metriothermophilus]